MQKILYQMTVVINALLDLIHTLQNMDETTLENEKITKSFLIEKVEDIMEDISEWRGNITKDEPVHTYFVNLLHQRNFEILLERFPVAKRNREYAAGCYIVAYPEIFKGIRVSELEHGPFDWYYQEKRGHLTDSTLRMVEAGLNLYNGEPFDLAECLDVWNKADKYKVFLQAVEIRKSGLVDY